jgi:peptidoglycan-N-acetylglucosamine deacetylase
MKTTACNRIDGHGLPFPGARLTGITLAAVLLAIAGCRTSPNAPAPEDTGDSTSEIATSAEAASVPERPQPEDFQYSRIEVDGPWIAITFDDGPDADQTGKLLDILKERNLPATFFVLGQRVAANRHHLERMMADGHEIGNHSWNHPYLDRLETDSVFQQLERTNEAIEAVTGRPTTLMRPPYGATNPALNEWINERFGMKVILWSIDSYDWRGSTSDQIRDVILEGIHPGAIVLAHDPQPATIAAMPETLDSLIEMGYRFVTVTELLALGEAGDVNPAINP